MSKESFASTLGHFLPKTKRDWEELETLGDLHASPEAFPLHLANSALSAHWQEGPVKTSPDLESASMAAVADLYEASAAHPEYFPDPAKGPQAPNPHRRIGFPYSCSFDSLSLAVLACLDLLEACDVQRRGVYLGPPDLESGNPRDFNFLELISGTSEDEYLSKTIYLASHATWGFFCKLNLPFLANENPNAGRAAKGLHFGKVARLVGKENGKTLYVPDLADYVDPLDPSQGVVQGDNYSAAFLEWIRYYHSVIRWGFFGTPAELEAQRKVPDSVGPKKKKRHQGAATDSLEEDVGEGDREKGNYEEGEMEEEEQPPKKKSRYGSPSSDYSENLDQELEFTPAEISGKQKSSSATEERFETLIGCGRSIVGHPERNSIVLPHVRDHFMHFYVYNLTAEFVVRKLIRGQGNLNKQRITERYDSCFTAFAPLGKVFPRHPPLARSAHDENASFADDADGSKMNEFVVKAASRSVLRRARTVASLPTRSGRPYKLDVPIDDPLRALHGMRSSQPKLDYLWGIWKSLKDVQGKAFPGMFHFSFGLQNFPNKEEKTKARGVSEAVLLEAPANSEDALRMPSLLALPGNAFKPPEQPTGREAGFADAGLFRLEEIYGTSKAPDALGHFITRRTLQAKCAKKVYSNVFALTRTHDKDTLVGGYYFGPLVLPVIELGTRAHTKLATFYPVAVIWHGTLHFSVDAMFPKEFGSSSTYPWTRTGEEMEEEPTTPLVISIERTGEMPDLEMPFASTHSWLSFDDYDPPSLGQSKLPLGGEGGSEGNCSFRFHPDVLRAFNEISRTAKSGEPNESPFPDVFSAGTCPPHRPVGDSRWTELALERNYSKAVPSKTRVKRWGGDLYLMTDPTGDKQISSVHYVKTDIPPEKVATHKHEKWQNFVKEFF